MAVESPLSASQLRERCQVLKAAPLFADLGAQDLATLAEAMEETQAKPGDTLLTQNEPAEGVYFLRDGGLKILINGEMVAQVDTVQCFGEMSCLMPDTPASATVVAAVPSRLLRMSRDRFLQVVEKIPKLWKTLFLQTSARFKKVNMRLSEVLEHTPQGLVRVDRQGKVTSEYSIHCTRYFSRENLAGLSFAELVLGAGSSEIGTWMETFGMLFEDSPLPFEDLAGLLTRDLKIDGADGHREYVLSYYPCREIDGRIVAIDVGVEDVTEARALERANSELRTQQETMGKIYDNPEAFLNMRKFVGTVLADGVDLAGRLKDGTAATLKSKFESSMRMLHSLKGFSGMFALKRVGEAAHTLEGLLREIQAQDEITAADRKRYVDGLVALKEQCKITETLMEKIGESLRKRLMGVVFTLSEFASLKKALEEGDSGTLKRLIRTAEALDCQRLFAAWPSEAARIAERLEKEAAFILGGEGGAIPRELFNALEQVLPHLLRNALDHGIEMPDLREEEGKPRAGQVTAIAEVLEGELRLKVEDDGRGVDLVHVADLARKKSHLNQKEVERLAASAEQWRILLLPGFSTSEKVTEFSGRGVGLDAVMDVIASRGGDLRIDTGPGEGTRVYCNIPLGEG